ncbi:MAG: guanylate kinase [candidate division Zixibacteria bacterium]|nr:guanylate kinase [candidate division Zixibacteria bacterium]
MQGKIIIISSPSGGGKSSLCRRLLSPHNKRNGWKFSISVTTRPRRKNERNGREYYFVSHPEFIKRRRRGEFAESCQVHHYYYGTPRRPLDEALFGGKTMVLDVDVKGAFKLKKKYPMAATIFILPPSKKELKHRLKLRGTEDDKHLKIRQERALNEMKLYRKFEYVVVNKILNTAVDEVVMIIKSLPCRFDNLDLEHINRIVG